MTTIKFSNGQSVKFNGNPSQSDIEYVAKQLGIVEKTPTPAGQFDIPSLPAPQIDHKAKLAELQQTVPQQTAQADAQGSFIGQVAGTVKEIGNMLSSSEQALGKTIGNTMATDEATQLANKSAQNDTQMALKFLRTISENDKAGKDTTHLKQIYNQWKMTQPNGSALPELPTMAEAAGQLGGVALDLLTSGSYGKGTVGMESGKLANQGVVSGLLAKTGIPSTSFQKTLPSVVQGVSDIATKPAGLFTKQGATTVAKGAGVGYGYDVSQGLQGNRGEDRTGSSAFIPGMNTLVAGGLPALAGFAQSVKNVASPSFNENLNKALPVLKKDVKTLATKQKDAYTAFNDIVANKDGLVLDEAGNTKSPKNYTFNDTVLAQGKRLKSIYKEYSNKLKGVDKSKFEGDIYDGIFKQIDNVTEELKTTNSLDSRRALTKIQKELGSLRDLSPSGIQKYIEDIGQKTRTGGGQAPTLEQIKYANLGGELRKILDTSVEKIDGTGYQDLRNVYKAHKTIESQLLQASKSELNKTPGWTDRLSNLGMTAEGINFLMTHDPHSLAIAGGIKGSTAYMKWLRSPQRALSNMFTEVEKAQSSSARPLTPSQINQAASKTPSAIISPNGTPETYFGQGLREGKQIGGAVIDYAKNPKLGMSIEDVSKSNPLARKYKTAEEFVKAQGTPVYHGTSAENANKINSEGFKTGAGRGISGQGSSDFIYSTESKQSAGKYVSDRLGIKNPTVVTGTFNGKVLDIQGKMADFEAFGEASKQLGVPLGKDSQGNLSMLDMSAIKKAMQEQGYGAIRFSDRYANGSKALAILPDQIKTSSQLIDIWKKAHAVQKESPIDAKFRRQEGAFSNTITKDKEKYLIVARKYKTAEEFVNNVGAIRDNYDWSYLDEMRARKAAGEPYSQSDFNVLSKLEATKRGLESRTFYRAGSVALDERGNMWLTPQEAGASQYGDASGITYNEYKVSTQKPLVLQDVKDLEKVLGKKLNSESNFTNSPTLKQEVIDYAKRNGYDSVLMPDSFPDGAAGMESLVVWDKNLVKTKSQLTDIWKQAHPEAQFSPQVQRIINMSK